MNETAIKVENLSKRYQIGRLRLPYRTLRDSLGTIFKLQRPKEEAPTEYIWALKDVSFEIKKGEAIGIIGRNGAGKTTLLKILSKITEPTEGRAIINGRASSLLEVGTGFHQELTGRENVYLNGAILGMRKREIDKKFDSIVAFAELEKFIDTPIKFYSSGMYIRLAFSVAAHLEPEILLVDEVLAVGDVAFQNKCLGKMEDVARKGKTVLFVSHNLISIMNLCPRTILLDSGNIIVDDSTPKTIERYIDREKHTGSEAIWSHPQDAPGNENVRLHAVRVLSEDGISVSRADIQKEILIELSYWNLKEGARLVPSIHLVSAQDVTVLTASNLPSTTLTRDPWYHRSMPVGLFKTICRIPANFLNEGTYFISVFIVSFLGVMTTHIVEHKIIHFDVFDTGGMRKEYTGPWLGVVRPKLAWSTEYIGMLEETACSNLEKKI